MTRSEILLAGLAAGGENATYTPVQVQKLFFLLDREASAALGGPHFKFVPYDYGPFDQSVYAGLDDLARRDLALVQNTGRYRVYGLTQAGQAEGRRALEALAPAARDYVANVARWVRQLSFQQLVASIYNKYPDMKANSVFRG
ncbi:hypothetical protein [Bradyrhizobium japonicum]|uniref:hypothetical protein n=1 Tax=Bradyrhizobium japonicum TaxID=375 RepID=UPI001B8A7D1F|nr:hypothetical protein [Bradyrhizobium japonicum]MBR0974096.1 hypothetical protein [Bradyrhizobium japonicum]